MTTTDTVTKTITEAEAEALMAAYHANIAHRAALTAKADAVLAETGDYAAWNAVMDERAVVIARFNEMHAIIRTAGQVVAL